MLITLRTQRAEHGILFHSGKCQRKITQLSGQSGTIESPGYPHSYGPVQTCIWQIKVNTGFRVHIHFDARFDVSRTPACRDEYVLISTRKQKFTDFNVVRNKKDSVVFCGDQKPSNVTSPANELWIRFKSKSGGRSGFRAWFGAEGTWLLGGGIQISLFSFYSAVYTHSNFKVSSIFLNI